MSSYFTQQTHGMKHMTNELQPAEHIQPMQPYVPGMSFEKLAELYDHDPRDIIKLASNENPRGCSPVIQSAINHAAATLNRYPDQGRLTEALAQFYGVEQNQITIGNGSNDVLDLVARAFLDADSEAISSEYGFIVYRLATQMTGAKNVFTKDTPTYTHDLDEMKNAITEKTRVIWIANPNNPTGTLLTNQQLRLFIETVPSNIVIVLDEAYYEYLPKNQASDSLRWVEQHPNLVVVRTFSKIYGLAGLRVGYAIASSKITELLNRVRQPFNVSGVALAAAEAALSDQAFVKDSFRANQEGKQQLEQGLTHMGYEFITSSANFVAVQFSDPEACKQFLLSRGIIVRPIKEYGLPQHLRITIGSSKENEALLAALKDFSKNSQP